MTCTVLLVKTSSLGDVIHTLPAVTDAARALPGITFTWVVEEAFAEIPAWHPSVREVIPVALRRWRKRPGQAWRSGEWQQFYRALRAQRYDYVLDAQGLIKSALLTRLAQGQRCGLDRHSAWEPLACLAYQQKAKVAPQQHAIVRMRQLFAQTLGYTYRDTVPDYGLSLARITPAPAGLVASAVAQRPYVVFLHGTTWDTKHWPESYWLDLARLAIAAGYAIKLPWGNAIEQSRAERLAQLDLTQMTVLPQLTLSAIVQVLSNAKAVVGVDSGLSHLAAALNVPGVSLYGPTDPNLTGVLAACHVRLAPQFPCAPCLQAHCSYRGAATVAPACFAQLMPELVWQRLSGMIRGEG